MQPPHLSGGALDVRRSKGGVGLGWGELAAAVPAGDNSPNWANSGGTGMAEMQNLHRL